MAIHHLQKHRHQKMQYKHNISHFNLDYLLLFLLLSRIWKCYTFCFKEVLLLSINLWKVKNVCRWDHQSCLHTCIFLCRSNIWLLMYMYPFAFFTFYWVYYKLTMWPTPRWLDTCSSVGRVRHRYHRSHGLECRLGLNFFSRLKFNS